jgi:hypothetical protein
MSDRITVTIGKLPPDLAGAWTLFLHHSDKTWWKTYRSRQEGWDEAVELELVSRWAVQLERHVVATELSLLYQASVDPTELEVRGFLVRGREGD